MCHHLGMVIRVALLSFVAFLLICISTRSNLPARFFSKEGESDRFVGQGQGGGGFVNKTWLDNQIGMIKEELYERISKEILLEKKSFEKPLSSEKKAVGDSHSELEVKWTETASGDQIRNVYVDTGENNSDTGDPGGQDVVTGEIGEHSAKAGDPGDPGFEFSTKEGPGSWRQRQVKRVRRLKNVCSRHQERSSFIESEKRR